MNNLSDHEQHLHLVRPVTSDQLRAFLGRMDSVIDLNKLEDATPFTDAGADSLDMFNIISEIQLATGLTIANQDIEQVNNLDGLVRYLNARMD
jgi:acyl carrier protein